MLATVACQQPLADNNGEEEVLHVSAQNFMDNRDNL
jgi:hypothetical protein